MSRMRSPTADDTVELVDEEQGLGVKYRLHQCFCGKYRCLVIALLILLVVFGIVFGVVWILTRPPKICKTALCYNISRDISSELDKSVDPCDDFYSYTCGGFFKRHKLKADQSRVNAFTILNEDNLNVLRHALQNSSFNYSQSVSIMKTVKIYNSCVNTAAIGQRGIAPLLNLIEQYGGWSVTGSGTNSWTVEQTMGKILRELNVQSLLTVTVRPDLTDSSKYIIQINPCKLGMSPSYYLTDKSENLKIQKAYKTFMKTIANLLGGGLNAEQKMMNIYDFEKSLAKAYKADAFSEDLVETLRQYHRSGRSLSSLENTLYEFSAASGFDLNFMPDFLNEAFNDQEITFDKSEKVFYLHKESGAAPIFESIYDTYFSYKAGNVVRDYIMWQVISKYVSSMPDQFVQAKRKFVEALAGVQEYERWSSCIEGMMTPMDMSLGRMYVDADFDETTKTTVKDMTSRVRKAFIDNLDSEDWMDSETKDAAKGKANAIKEDVGYPSFIKDDSKLDAYYSMLTVGDDFFENTVAMNRMLVQKNLGVLRKQVDKDMWMSGPAQVNGYYSPQQNRIVFLAGILQSPFFKKNYPKYFNYGSLAMVIGHEITHGFDSSGRLFDKDGNVKDWWSYSSALNFQTRAQCLVNQYSNYEVFGEYIDGRQTLNENIADNGGIKLAYDAYQSWVSDNEKEGQLPDLDLSVDQLFFIGFAMPWCSVYKKEAALFQVKSDEHSYNKYRVIGSLSNFKRFGKAFGCKRGTNMDRETKCAVW